MSNSLHTVCLSTQSHVENEHYCIPMKIEFRAAIARPHDEI